MHTQVAKNTEILPFLGWIDFPRAVFLKCLVRGVLEGCLGVVLASVRLVRVQATGSLAACLKNDWKTGEVGTSKSCRWAMLLPLFTLLWDLLMFF